MRHERTARAFTLVEMIIVVGAIAIIGLGVARIFSATGDTVRIGRQISTLNANTASLERQMRSDIGQMTRDGVMVLKQETQSGRRVDQMLFFAKGTFTSNRDPLHPQREVQAPAARIYYGHGHIAEGASNQSTDRLKVGIQVNIPYFAGVNADPANWILLRHVTAMALPRTGVQEVLTEPVPANGWFSRNEQADTDSQVALLPAAASLFRNMNALAQGRNGARTAAGQTIAPIFGSGIVDLATTDLDEVRAVVLDAQDLGAVRYPFDPQSDSADEVMTEGSPFLGLNGVAFPFGGANGTLDNMQGWMLQLFPVRSYGNNPQRMRCALAAPDAFGVIDDGLITDAATLTEIVADQRMLSASNFVARCTDFRIEWTFSLDGDLGTPGVQPLWYDLDETYGENGELFEQTFPTLRGPVEYVHPIRVVTEQDGGNGQLSYFGYVDPLFDGGGTNQTNPAGVATLVSSLPWPWPTHLRFTVSFLDSDIEDARERTVQFVIAVPNDELQSIRVPAEPF